MDIMNIINKIQKESLQSKRDNIVSRKKNKNINITGLARKKLSYLTDSKSNHKKSFVLARTTSSKFFNKQQYLLEPNVY